MKGYFSGECSHRVCVDGIQKIIFPIKTTDVDGGFDCLLGSFSNDYGDGNENGKKSNRYRLVKKHNFARAARFFGTFFCRHCTTTT